jgi:hypothetical protein
MVRLNARRPSRLISSAARRYKIQLRTASTVVGGAVSTIGAGYPHGKAFR